MMTYAQRKALLKKIRDEGRIIGTAPSPAAATPSVASDAGGVQGDVHHVLPGKGEPAGKPGNQSADRVRPTAPRGKLVLATTIVTLFVAVIAFLFGGCESRLSAADAIGAADSVVAAKKRAGPAVAGGSAVHVTFILDTSPWANSQRWSSFKKITLAVFDDLEPGDTVSIITGQRGKGGPAARFTVTKKKDDGAALLSVAFREHIDKHAEQPPDLVRGVEQAIAHRGGDAVQHVIVVLQNQPLSAPETRRLLDLAMKHREKVRIVLAAPTDLEKDSLVLQGAAGNIIRYHNLEYPFKPAAHLPEREHGKATLDAAEQARRSAEAAQDDVRKLREQTAKAQADFDTAKRQAGELREQMESLRAAQRDLAATADQQAASRRQADIALVKKLADARAAQIALDDLARKSAAGQQELAAEAERQQAAAQVKAAQEEADRAAQATRQAQSDALSANASARDARADADRARQDADAARGQALRDRADANQVERHIAELQEQLRDVRGQKEQAEQANSKKSALPAAPAAAISELSPPPRPITTDSAGIDTGAQNAIASTNSAAGAGSNIMKWVVAGAILAALAGMLYIGLRRLGADWTIDLQMTRPDGVTNLAIALAPCESQALLNIAEGEAPSVSRGRLCRSVRLRVPDNAEFTVWMDDGDEPLEPASYRLDLGSRFAIQYAGVRSAFFIRSIIHADEAHAELDADVQRA